MQASTDATRVLRDFARFPQQAATALDPVVRRTTVDLQRVVRGKASGRPGPRVRTGDYRRAWRAGYKRESRAGISHLVGTVSNNKPQAHRLERGFIGMDSLGRMYNQPAYPHLAPAVAEVEPRFRRDARAALGRAITGRSSL